MIKLKIFFIILIINLIYTYDYKKSLQNKINEKLRNINSNDHLEIDENKRFIIKPDKNNTLGNIIRRILNERNPKANKKQSEYKSNIGPGTVEKVLKNY